MSKKPKKKYYVVVHGRKRGIYTQWFGDEGAADQVRNVSDALFKGFYTLQSARDWLLDMDGVEDLLEEIDLVLAPTPGLPRREPALDYQADLAAGKVVIFTDGGADPNPGPGGYGVVLLYKDHRKELCGGFQLTTNNRMELLACIEGLRALKHPMPTVLYSDSKYVVDAINKGWACRWREKGWLRRKGQRAENSDLWAILLKLCDRYEVEFRWVRGHAGIRENERCDQLATQARQVPDLPQDVAYERGETQIEVTPALLEPR